MEPFSLLAFLGALAIFIYGIRLSRLGIQLLAGERFRSLITSLTGNRFSAVTTGVLMTLILQSSTATTAMVIGFASSGLLSLAQGMGIILGADIGTTLVILLLSFKKIATYSFLPLVIGVGLEIFSERKKGHHAGMVLIGFGFVFFGMRLMVESTLPLQESHFLREAFRLLGESPGYAFLGTLLLTALVQNSATTLGLIMALAFSGFVSLPTAIPLVLGANLGTCAVALIHSFRGEIEGKRVAFSHLFFKATGAVLVLLFLGPIARLAELGIALFPILAGRLPLQIALAHVSFNLALSLLFLPFIRQGVWLVQKWMPTPRFVEEKKFHSKFLEAKALETPPLACANAKLEIIRMADITLEMFQDVITVFQHDDQDLIDLIEEKDDKVDYLNREIKFYLAKISQEVLSPEQARLQLHLVAMTSDLEEIGDIINKNILELAQKKIRKVRHFSEEGWKEIVDFHTKIVENFRLTLSLLATEDESLARKVSRHEEFLVQLEERYREAHLQRLHRGLKETIETSSIHLDLLSNFRRVNSKLMAIVQATVTEKVA